MNLFPLHLIAPALESPLYLNPTQVTSVGVVNERVVLHNPDGSYYITVVPEKFIYSVVAAFNCALAGQFTNTVDVLNHLMKKIGPENES